MSDPDRCCCFMCHRYRPAAKMDETGRRCADREACLTAAAKAAPVSVPKRVLRKQYANGDNDPVTAQRKSLGAV